MEYSCISICRASTCKDSRVTQRVVREQVECVNGTGVQNNIQNPRNSLESLVNIEGPVRQAMHLKCQSTDANFKIDKASQIESVLIELFALVNFILEASISPKMVFENNHLH